MMVSILDCTLREGEQSPGVCFSPHVRHAIAELLDEIGVNFIEAGHPTVSSRIEESVRAISRSGLRATVAAHSRSMRSDVDKAIDSGAEFIGIFYCVSDQRLQQVFNKNLAAAIDTITDIIEFARGRNRNLTIRYTPEDTVRSSFDNVVQASVAAVRAGADIISVADTTGFMVPRTENNFTDYVNRLKLAFAEAGIAPRLAAHCHNDRGLALANALEAWSAGAEIIDASVLGLGERAGIVDLAQLLTVLQVDHRVGTWKLDLLPELYALVSKFAGIEIHPHQPLTGTHAFTHCAGVHTHAALVNPLHYESLPPELLGRRRHIALDQMSGLSSVRHSLREINAPEEFATSLLPQVKALGEQGKTIDLEELRLLVNAHQRTEAAV
jgi:2-isopropylmalate synthase